MKVHLSTRAVKEFQACPPEIRAALLAAIEGLAKNSRPPGARRLSGALAGSRRLRVGSWRILYDIFDREHTVLITKIGPRKSVYR